VKRLELQAGKRGKRGIILLAHTPTPKLVPQVNGPGQKTGLIINAIVTSPTTKSRNNGWNPIMT